MSDTPAAAPKVPCPKCQADLIPVDDRLYCPKCVKYFCGRLSVVFSRVVGYYRGIKRTPEYQSAWNKGKQEEFKNRLEFNPEKFSEPGKHHELMTTLRGETEEHQ